MRGVLTSIGLGLLTTLVGGSELLAAEAPAAAGAAAVAAGADTHWPGFRGAQAAGVAEGFPLPVQWDARTKTGVRWQTDIPGLAHSSPVVWGNRLFVTTAVGPTSVAPLRVGLYGDINPADDDGVHEWRVYGLDKATGAVVWSQTACTGVPKTRRHPKSSHANPTPATDGRHLVAFFGSEGLYCYELDGKLLWHQDLGVLESAFFRAPAAQWGFASSPVIWQDRVIVQCDVLKSSFVGAFALDSGKPLWRTARDDVPTWSTPTVVASEGRTQVVANGFRHMAGYDIATGKELWRLAGGGDIPVPTPVAAHGLIYLAGAHGPAAPLFAVRVSAGGDLALQPGASANAGVAWSQPRNGAYMQTPLVYGDYLYSCMDTGVLTCYRAATGEVVYRERLATGVGFSASPVAGDGKLYFTGEPGTVHVLRAGPTFERLAANEMGSVCMATPAVSAGVIYFRTRQAVVAIGGK